MPGASTPQAERLRRDLAQLTDLAVSDLRRLVVFDAAESTRDALVDVLPRLVALYGEASSSLAADWYDDMRDEVAVRGRFLAIPAELPTKMGTDELARWATNPLFAAKPDVASARSLVEGGMQRRIANQSRETLTVSTVQDPAAVGWQRVGGGGCAFCDMLIGRGEVYSQASADFASHDHCRCSAQPVFGGQSTPVKPYTPSSRNVSDADRARVREFIRTQ